MVICRAEFERRVHQHWRVSGLKGHHVSRFDTDGNTVLWRSGALDGYSKIYNLPWSLLRASATTWPRKISRAISENPLTNSKVAEQVERLIRYWRPIVILLASGLGDPSFFGCLFCFMASGSGSLLISFLNLVGGYSWRLIVVVDVCTVAVSIRFWKSAFLIWLRLLILAVYIYGFGNSRRNLTHDFCRTSA